MSAPASPKSSPSLILLLCTGCLLLGTGLLYLQTVGFDFVTFDDDLNIFANPLLGTPSWKDLGWMFAGQGYMLRYLPLTWLFWDLIHVVSGSEAWGFHLANLLLQVASTWLLFLCLRKLLRLARSPEEGQESAWSLIVATLSAALWSWHPLRVELVAWASGLLYLHAAFWMLLASYAYLQALEDRLRLGRWNGWLLLSLIAYLGSLLSYPVAIGFPAAVLALTWWKLPPSSVTRWQAWRSWFANGRGVLLSAGLALFFSILAVLIRILRANPDRAAADMETFPLLSRFVQSAYVLAHSLWKTLLPSSLTPVPTDLLHIAPLDLRFLLAYLSLALLLGLVFVFRRHQAAWLLLLAFLGLQIPFLGFMEHPYFPCDRYSYYPGLVLAAALALGLSRLKRHRLQISALALLALLAGLLADANRRQQLIWQNDDSLYATIRARVGSQEFGESYMQRLKEVKANALISQRTVGSLPSLFFLCGNNSAALGKPFDAEQWFRITLRYSPLFAKARYNLAQLCLNNGRCREATAHYVWLKAHPADLGPEQIQALLLRLINTAAVLDDKPLLQALRAELERTHRAPPRT